VESPTEDETMGFYTRAELPFYLRPRANSPSLNTPIGTAAPPVNDCGPFSGVSTTP
jgi:hypothetical protein